MRKPRLKAQSPGNKQEKKSAAEGLAPSGGNTAGPKTTTSVTASHAPYRGLRRRPIAKQM
jgi:hypothetical protein